MPKPSYRFWINNNCGLLHFHLKQNQGAGKGAKHCITGRFSGICALGELFYGVALRLRAAKTDPGPLQESHELREFVRKSFEGRQQLQRAELADLQQRMRHIRKSIELRERIADQIIDRRIEELLNPNRRWKTKGVTESDQGPAYKSK